MTQEQLQEIYNEQYERGQSDYKTGQTQGNTRQAYDDQIAERYSMRGYHEGWRQAHLAAHNQNW